MASLRAACAVVSVLALAACERSSEASQVAARVNDADVTVHQVNFALQQMEPPPDADQVEAAGRRTLELLIDQELAVQKAVDLRLDRDPQVVQALESARREVLARAYRERVSQDGVEPTSAEVRRFYDANPALFAQRRVYTFDEVTIDADPARWAALQDRALSAGSGEALVGWLDAQGVRATASQLVRAAEQLPMQQVGSMAQVPIGRGVVVAAGPPVRVHVVVSSRPEPLSFEQAAPAIERYLTTQTRRRRIEDNLKALRTAAQVKYMGRFSGPASGPATGAASGAAREAAALEASPEPVRLDLSGVLPAASSANGAMDPNLAKKGLGLK